MKKRWEFNPWPYLGFWIAAGLVALFAIQGLTGGCSREYPDECGVSGPISSATRIELIVWLGPFVVPIVTYCIIAGTRNTVTALWRARPRRIEEPVLEDLRQVK